MSCAHHLILIVVELVLEAVRLGKVVVVPMIAM
jgi:hypothetical protein